MGFEMRCTALCLLLASACGSSPPRATEHAPSAASGEASCGPRLVGSPSQVTLPPDGRGYVVSDQCTLTIGEARYGVSGRGSARPGLGVLSEAIERACRDAGIQSVFGVGTGIGCNASGLRVYVSDWAEVGRVLEVVGGVLERMDANVDVGLLVTGGWCTEELRGAEG
ncbi:hypothetical protein [Sandaracinus amylolyticus]|uniref:hypothetical protein n=1 Tax=Sandaracinus amylolyticus TaxID=927083 RepID=UPI001F3C86DB|nr:hypothetical protein [Sandaracinus amylolyticus]UJR81897.1 Hypothetical protein I5071_39620 [Sandaracinus amylolyticus]